MSKRKDCSPIDTAGSTTATAAPPERPEAAPPELAERLERRVEERQRLREKSRQGEEERVWNVYRAGVLGDKPPADLEAFDAVCSELGIPPAQVQGDCEIVRAAREQHQFLGEYGEAMKVCAEKRAVVLGLRRKFDEEYRLARRELSDAELRVSQGHGAAYELSKLAKQRPELFNVTADPPRLRDPATAG